MEEKKEESCCEDKAEIQKKKFEGIWSNAKQSEVVVKMEEKKEEVTARMKLIFRRKSLRTFGAMRIC